MRRLAAMGMVVLTLLSACGAATATPEGSPPSAPPDSPPAASTPIPAATSAATTEPPLATASPLSSPSAAASPTPAPTPSLLDQALVVSAFGAVEKIPVPGESKRGPAAPAQCSNSSGFTYQCHAQFGNGGQVILAAEVHGTEKAAKSLYASLKKWAPKGTGRTTVALTILGQKANLYLLEQAQMGGHCHGQFVYRIDTTVWNFFFQGLQKPNVGVCAGPEMTIAYLRKAVPAINEVLAGP